MRQTGATVVTLRAGFSEAQLDEVNPQLIFLSPGPGSPTDFKLSTTIEMAQRRKLPIFGVCLGAARFRLLLRTPCSADLLDSMPDTALGSRNAPARRRTSRRAWTGRSTGVALRTMVGSPAATAATAAAA